MCFCLLPVQGRTRSIVIEKTTCNLLKTPWELNLPSPYFGWQLSSDRRNQSQSAYQIMVADNEKDINAFTGNIWDSGENNLFR